MEHPHLATKHSVSFAVGRTGACVDDVGALHLDSGAAAKSLRAVHSLRGRPHGRVRLDACVVAKSYRTVQSHRAHHHVAAAPMKGHFARIQGVHNPSSVDFLRCDRRCLRELHQQRHRFLVAQRRRRCHRGPSDTDCTLGSCNCLLRWCRRAESRHCRGNAIKRCSAARVATKHVERYFGCCRGEAETLECGIELRLFEGVEVGDFDDLPRHGLNDRQRIGHHR